VSAPARSTEPGLIVVQRERRGVAHLSPRRWGLRTRITTSYALGALLLSIALASITFLVARSTFIRQREDNLVAQALLNASVVNGGFDSSGISVLQRIAKPTNTRSAIWGASQADATKEWISFPDLLNGEPENLVPTSLFERVQTGRTANVMWVQQADAPSLVVGVALETQIASSYFEVTRTGDLADTFRSLRLVLVGAAALTTLLGAALGIWSSRLVTRPLDQAARAAEAIAGGRLDTRLEPVDDRDLAVLTSAFNDMAASLEDRIERDQRFASDVSHELRSPLMTLAASAEVLQSRRDELSDKAQAALDLLTADVSRFQGLVEDLLEISRFDVGQVRLHLDFVLAAEFVPLAVRIVDTSVPVTLDETLGDTVVRLDKRRMARVLANLLENARFYAGGATRVDVTRTDTDVVISVEDNGPGVPPDERTLIFERFARGTGAGNRSVSEGAGLGLSLVAEHVRLHGGRVYVSDRVDAHPGARFVIELPAEPDDDGNTP
jgi:two-component system, OmpR family, sensor histidine kinase MtrB